MDASVKSKKSIFKGMIVFVGSSIVLAFCAWVVFLIASRYDYTGDLVQFFFDNKILVIGLLLSLPFLFTAHFFSSHPIGHRSKNLILLGDMLVIAGSIGYFVFGIPLHILLIFFAVLLAIMPLFRVKKKLFHFLFVTFLGGSIVAFIFFQIPNYPYTVSLETILSYQPYHLTLADPEVRVEVLTKNKERLTFTTKALGKDQKKTFTFQEQPLSIEVSSQNPKGKSNSEKAVRIIFPDMTYMYVSPDAFLVFSGYNILFMQGSGQGFSPTNHRTCSGCLLMRYSPWEQISSGISAPSGEERNEVKSIYFSSRYETAKTLYKRKFTDREALEKIIYRKLYVGKILMPKKYNLPFENFLLYRYVLGKSTYGHSITAGFNIPAQESKNVMDENSSSRNDKNTHYMHMREGISKTKYLKFLNK